MKMKLFLGVLALATLTVSCSKNESETNQAPSNFSLTASTAEINKINLDWSDSIDPEASKVTYNVYLNSEKIASGLTASQYVLENLQAATTYTVKIEALDNSGNITTVTQEIKTSEAPFPTAVKIVQSEKGKTSFKISWEAATIANNSEIKYDVFLEGELKASDITDLEHTFLELERDRFYEVKVQAKSVYGTAIHSIERLSTEPYQHFIRFGAIDLPPGGPTRESLLGHVKLPVEVFPRFDGPASADEDIILEFEVKGGNVNHFDYHIITPSPLIIPAGATEAFIEVAIIDDNMEEDDERFYIESIKVTNSKLSGRTNTGFIIDGMVDGVLSAANLDGYMVDITWNNTGVNIDAVLRKEQANGISGSAAFYDSTDYPESFLLASSRPNGKYYLDIERNGAFSGPLEVSIWIQEPKENETDAMRNFIKPVYVILPEGESFRTVYEIDIVDGVYTFTESMD